METKKYMYPNLARVQRDPLRPNPFLLIGGKVIFFTSKLSVVANPLLPAAAAEVVVVVLSAPEVSDKFPSSFCPVYHPDRKVPSPFCLPNHDVSGSPCRRPGS